jgi:D-psicose/D-tagatose/L-ribulose 3-epimerase
MSLPVKFGVSTWLWTSPFNNESINLFPKIKEMGFDVIEIPVEDPALIDSVKIRKALEDNHLEPVVCGVFNDERDFTHDDSSYHENCFRYLHSCFDICEEIGARFVAGPMYSAVGKARPASNEQRQVEWNRAVANLRRVCEAAASRHLQIAIEPLNRFESDLVNNSKTVMRLINDINHPAANVLLDGFHMSIEESNMEEAVKLVGNRLLHVQVSENTRGIPGSGQTQWDSFRQGLEAVNYQGAITIESFTPHVKALSSAVCIWHPLADSQDRFATEGLRFLKKWIAPFNNHRHSSSFQQTVL